MYEIIVSILGPGIFGHLFVGPAVCDEPMNCHPKQCGYRAETETDQKRNAKENPNRFPRFDLRTDLCHRSTHPNRTGKEGRQDQHYPQQGR
jgi:hypothetical protein